MRSGATPNKPQANPKNRSPLVLLAPPNDYRAPPGWGGLSKSILGLIFSYLSAEKFHQVAPVNWWWALAARLFNKTHEDFFKRDFPEIYEIIQEKKHFVRDWREEYFWVEKYANCSPNYFSNIKEQKWLIKNWKTEFKYLLGTPIWNQNGEPSPRKSEYWTTDHEAFFLLISKQLGNEMAFFLEKKFYVKQQNFIRAVISWLKYWNPLSPTRPIERTKPEKCAQLRDEIWNFFLWKEEYSHFLPELAILTHQPMERLKDLIIKQGKNKEGKISDLEDSAVPVFNLNAIKFLFTWFSNILRAPERMRSLARLAWKHGFFDLYFYLIKEHQVEVEILVNDGNFEFAPPIGIIRFLVEEKGLDPNSALDNGDGGTTALLYELCSFRRINLDTVKYLVDDKQAEIDTENSIRETPISIACQMGNLELIKFLFQRLEVAPNYVTMLKMIVSSEYYGFREERLPTLKFLIEEKGLDLAYYDSVFSQATGGSGLIQCAAFNDAEEGSDELCEYLLMKGANPLLCNIRAFYGIKKNEEIVIPEETKKLIRINLNRILYENSDLAQAFLKNLKIFYRDALSREWGVNGCPKDLSFLLLCAVAIQKSIAEIRNIMNSIPDGFSDPAYSDLLLKLCQKFHPEAQELIFGPPQSQPEELEEFSIVEPTNQELVAEFPPASPGAYTFDFFDLPDFELPNEDEEGAGYDNPNMHKRTFGK